jgi:glycogen phosphorylase
LKIVGRMAVFPVLPERLARLYSLAYNLWWVWHPQAQELYQMIDPALWENTHHNAIRLLSEVDPQRLEDLTHDTHFTGLYDRALASFDAYIDGGAQTWYQRAHDHHLSGPVAYFSAEFGLHESLPIYSGGLGILAGDHCKEASDLGLPLVGVGFLYPQGYFRQRITRTGDQEAIYDRLNFADLPAEVARDPQGREAMISVDLNGRRVYARIWKFQIGRNPLYLMDTDVEENDPRDRVLSARLYGGDQEMRIAQEIVLGIGGVRALRKLGITPAVWHMNESHSAFVGLERIRELVEEQELTFDEALKVVQANGVFTTHTPVPAGNDAFSFELMDRYFRDYMLRLGLTRDQFVNFARQDQSWGPSFSMTVLALKASSKRNGVSALHGDVSRRMWQFLWNSLDTEEVPITSITNGIHSPTWVAPQLGEFYARYLGNDWQERIDDAELWRKLEQAPDHELWQTHQALKNRMIENARLRFRQRADRLGEGAALAGGNQTLLNPQALTIGFARRFATYKRATLLFRDRERLLRILNTPGKPVQIIFAGKAHPADEPGKALIKQIEHYSREPEFAGKVVLLEEYDMDMARHLVSGVDIWLNTPIRPHEASGTSGQKASLNAIPNCSIMDGWWAEGFNGRNGWSIGEDREYINPDVQNDEDVDSLYTILEHQIIPTFFDIGTDGVPHTWVRIMKEAAMTVGPQFSMRRMVKEYIEMLYLPAFNLGRALTTDHFATARELAAWESRIRSAWPSVAMEAHGPHDGQMAVNSPIDVTATVTLGSLSMRDVAVELVWGNDDNGRIRQPTTVAMTPSQIQPDGRQIYTTRFAPDRNGSFIYGVRIRPYHPALVDSNETGLMLWAQ